MTTEVKQCTKIKLDTLSAADAAVKKMRAKYGTLFKHYWCYKCSAYHVAHSVPRAKMKEIMAKFGLEYTQ